MADNIKYRFIQNVGDYFPSGYFSDDFLEKVQKCAGLSIEELKSLCTPFVGLQHFYDEYKNFIINDHPRVEDAIKKTHDFHSRLLKILGYETSHAYQEHCIVNEEADPIEMIPVRHILHHGNQVKMFVMEMQNLIAIDEKQPAGLFEQQYESEPSRSTRQQKYYAGQWRFVFEIDKEKYKISPSIINKALTQIFLLPEERRPHFILMLAGNAVFLFDKDKWAKGSYLQFSLDELFAQARVPAFRNYYALFHLLTSKQTLAADGEMVLMDSIIEESYTNAYEVTKDLKEGVILAVETLANEALYWWKKHDNIPVPDYTDDGFEAEVKDDCLTIIYRLLFLFYAESREELEILPLNDEVYKRGYSLESLRDLEMVRLNSQESRDGYFFDDSIRHLFRLLSDGHNATLTGQFKSFRVRPIDSPLFNDNNLRHLGTVRIRNVKWQEIIRALSLSKKKNYCGRISYANLGVNQLGSVYESLLAFRGFYAEEDYIEVHKANAPQDGTFLVPYSRMEDFNISEVLCNDEGKPQKILQGTFVYRLNGRDRQKSASYYTPEVLTRSTVKYTLKSIIDDVASGRRKAPELLDLKILEPAMGAAAFLNEVINQLAEAYLTYQQQQLRERGAKNWRIQPDRYRDELQRVKAFIATHNVYGVDLNPTAIELGKLSLWLNVIHKEMETPFFANRLAVGNAVIGAWLKVYNQKEVCGLKGRKNRLEQNKWWEKSPHKVMFFQNRVNRSVGEVYHFLLPDANMLGVRGIREQKQAHPAEHNRMTTLMKDWTAPVTADDFKTLQRLSAKIDLLLKEYFTDQLSIDRYTNNRNQVWDGTERQQETFREEAQAESYTQKQRLLDTRNRHGSAYYKLKLAMDYWCALWFWEYDDAESLPNRQEYWADIEALLDVDNGLLDRRTRLALERAGSGIVSEDEPPEYGNRMTEEESQIVTKTQEEILAESQSAQKLFDEPRRLRTAHRLATRYHFFHPMLEFIEVFWLRDGFDIICGNPPWIKLQFNEKDIISDKYPEVVIRNESAPVVRQRIAQFMQNKTLSDLYNSELTEQTCSTAFLNAYANYPLLVGQQTNLYKCVLENCMEMASPEKGYIGLLTPESIYNDPNGQPLRCYLYKRLRYHFQYENEFNLFTGTNDHGRMRFGENVLGCQSTVHFCNINNVYHPNTVDACFTHDGHGLCGGIKDKNGNWNTAAHRDRIVEFTDRELQVLSDTFEDGTTGDCAKLVSIHCKEIIEVLEKISSYPTRLKDVENVISNCFHETGAVDKGIICRKTCEPNIEDYQMIYNGPSFYVGNPLYQTPQIKCVQNSDYDIIDLTKREDYLQRTNYIPCIPKDEYKNSVQGFVVSQDKDGNPIYDSFIDYYKATMRCMLNNTGERTLICAVLPRRTAHINAVISAAFRSGNNCVDTAALFSSLPLDFYTKTIGIGQIGKDMLSKYPFGFDSKYQSAVRIRTLLLNCLTRHYADLWEEMWREEYRQEQWSLEDKRLKPFGGLTEQWEWNTPLRGYFERRQALVEIDVIAAIALGLSLEDLEMIYTIQFPVLQQNEADTWYDAEGKIVFTCSKGLTGVGLDRPAWNAMRGNEVKDGRGEVVAYEGATPTYLHTISPAKSELYGGRQQTFVAPYTRPDRIADYRRAWAHFERRFNNEK